MKLLFWFAAACLHTSIQMTFAEDTPQPENPVLIYMIGDSTMCNYSLDHDNPQRGWGQLLPEFVQDGVKVENRAAGGRSSRSFVKEGRWAKIMETLKPGDWVVIQFGHNDQKKDKPEIYTDPETDYRTFLKDFIKDTRANGARPVLATSIYRRYFDQEGHPKNSLGGYPEATRAVAEEMNVPLVDLNELTGILLAEAGVENSKKLFLHCEPGEHPLFPDGRHDNSHLSETGARAIAKLFADAVRDLKISFPLKP